MALRKRRKIRSNLFFLINYNIESISKSYILFDYLINNNYLYVIIFNNIHCKIMHFLHFFAILIFNINIYICIKYIYIK